MIARLSDAPRRTATLYAVVMTDCDAVSPFGVRISKGITVKMSISDLA